MLGILTLLGTSPLVIAPAGVIALGFGELMPEEMFGEAPPRQYWLVRAIARPRRGRFRRAGAVRTVSPLTMLSWASISLGVGLCLPLGTQAGSAAGSNGACGRSPASR